MNLPTRILPLLRWYSFFQFLRTGQPHLDNRFFAVNGSIEDTRIIAVLVSISVPFHNERPFALVSFFPVERDSREIVAEIKAHNHRFLPLQCGPEHLLHEFGTWIEREAGRE